MCVCVCKLFIRIMFYRTVVSRDNISRLSFPPSLITGFNNNNGREQKLLLSCRRRKGRDHGGFKQRKIIHESYTI